MKKVNSIYHILLADDDADHAALFERILTREYPEVKLSFVNDGLQALQFLRLNQVDLLFLDLNMPCKNGYELFTAVLPI